MKKKVCLITGGNSGIGKAAATAIARGGHTVVIACRSRERGESAMEDIRREAGTGKVELEIVDMSLQTSIREMARSFHSRHTELDVLIHNAADFDIARKTPERTREGIERVWATNHIGPVLLTDLMLETLKRNAQGRIVTIASKGLVMYPRLEVDLDDPEFTRRPFSVQRAYYQSKLAQLMYTYWLAERLMGSGVTANCIRVTNVKIDISRYENLSKLSRFAYSLKSRFSITPEKMAEAYLYLAVSEEASSLTGKYLDERCRSVHSSRYSRNPESIEGVMQLTMRYIEGKKSRSGV